MERIEFQGTYYCTDCPKIPKWTCISYKNGISRLVSEPGREPYEKLEPIINCPDRKYPEEQKV